MHYYVITLICDIFDLQFDFANQDMTLKNSITLSRYDLNTAQTAHVFLTIC